MFPREDTGFNDKNGTRIFSGDYVQGKTIDGSEVVEVGVVRQYLKSRHIPTTRWGIDWNFFGNDIVPDFANVEIIGSEQKDGDTCYPDPKE